MYAAELVNDFQHGWSVDGLEKDLRESYPIVSEIEKMAEDRDIPVYETFSGTTIGAFTVLSKRSRGYRITGKQNFGQAVKRLR